MDETTVRAMLLQQFENAGSDPELAHAMYHDDAVLEFPQSGERFVGLENFREWRSNYPASTSFEIQEVRGRDDLWVVELTVSYDQGPVSFGVSVHEFRGDTGSRARRSTSPRAGRHPNGGRSGGPPPRCNHSARC